MKRPISIVFLLSLVCGLPSTALGWGNKSAHPAINQGAFKIFKEWYERDNRVSSFRFTIDTEVSYTGEAISSTGWEFVDRAQRKLKVERWIMHGGFSADEPEIPAAWRHFFDFFQAAGVAYLTDSVPDGYLVNPKMDAKTWALSAPDNAFGFEKAKKAYRDAMAGTSAEANFAFAFRALGENMHLVADMAQPAHVRNDTHSFYCPLENTVNGKMVEPQSGKPVDSRLSIDWLPPDQLFDELAKYTNSHFYSADTIYNAANPEVLPKNGQTPNQKPQFSDLVWDETRYNWEGVFDGNQIPILAETCTSYYARKKNPAEPPKYYVASYFSEQHCSILIPAAMHGAAQLMKYFLPKLYINVSYVMEGSEGEKVARITATASDGSYSYDEEAPILYTGPARVLHLRYPAPEEDAKQIGTIQFKNGETPEPFSLDVPEDPEHLNRWFIEIRAGGAIHRSRPFSPG